MTIEATLERIAGALEKIAAQQGVLQPPTEPVPEKRGRGRPPKEAKPVEAPAAAPPAVDEDLSVGDEEDDFLGDDEPAAPAEITLEMVRTELLNLQKKVSPKAAKELLQNVGKAVSLKLLAKDKYRDVYIAAVDAVKVKGD